MKNTPTNKTNRGSYRPSKSRIHFLYIVVVVLTVALVGQLYMVQIVRGEDYREEAENQYASPSSNFNRGAIYFSNNGDEPIKAARLTQGFILAIVPADIQNPEETYTKISNIITIDKTKFLKASQKKDDPYEEITEHITQENRDKIAELNLSGVRLFSQKWRSYPWEDTAAHVLGFYGYSGDSKTGRYGLEQYYDEVLSKESSDLSVNFFAEVFANIKATSETVTTGARKQGKGDLYTTIEATVQKEFEKNLEAAQKKWSADSISGIVMNPDNGEIYSMASTPRFNPNEYSKSEIKDFANPLVGSVFEMGSIIKPLTMAAGIDDGAVTPQSTYNDTGSTRVSGQRVSNYDFKARGITDMQTVLNKSLNLGVMHVMQEMGHEDFARYMTEYGLDEETGVDLPDEVRGNLNFQNKRDVGYATASFGQGIALTPIATIRALSALGNGGTLPDPHIVKKIDYTYGPSWEFSPNTETRVLKKETSEKISRMLVGVMDDAMLGGTVALDDHTIAAKTGTAQIPSPDGGYYEDRYIHTYFGYFPAYDPQFIVFLQINNPKGVQYASRSLTTPFMDTAKFLLNYYEVPPDR